MNRSHRFNPTLLREYDVRGVVGQTLSAEDARALGRAFGTRVARSGGRRVAVGRDGRLSSPEMEEAVVDGLKRCGLSIHRTGMGPTPMLYFAVRHLGLDAGVMVTGSHNPAQYNGFKLMLGKGTLHGADIQALGTIAAAGDFASGAGSVADVAVLDAYVDRLVSEVAGWRDLTVVWDSGNGASGPIVSRLAARLPGRHVLLNEEVDGRFPAHHPDPTVAENLVQLQDAVAREKADLGIGLDGDGDRIGVVDGRGRILWGDQLMVVLAEPVLKNQPGATIIADVKASQVLFDEIARMGGKPLMWRTGHSLIKAKMMETGAPLAGEMSGHIFFADRWYGFDDAQYAAIRLLEILARGDMSLAALRDRLPEAVNTPELRFTCSEGRKFAVVDEIRARLEQAGARMQTVDGVRVRTEDGWWLLRASNTQDVLVARCEAASNAGLDRLRAALVDQLSRSGLDATGLGGLH